jgi:uncharacterized glyoxalase superfamily protein PhnB
MKETFKPQCYNSLSPYFVVKDATNFVDFLKRLFGAKELRKYDRPDGTIMHIELQIDDSVIMIGDSSEAFPPNNHLLHLYVPDVDETYKKALALGCESVEVPSQRDGDPDKRGTFKDHAGNTWSIGTQL